MTPYCSSKVLRLPGTHTALRCRSYGLSLSLSLSRFLPLSLSLRHTHTHTHTLTLSLSRALSLLHLSPLSMCALSVLRRRTQICRGGDAVWELLELRLLTPQLLELSFMPPFRTKSPATSYKPTADKAVPPPHVLTSSRPHVAAMSPHLVAFILCKSRIRMRLMSLT
jgi:hypothetical protein